MNYIFKKHRALIETIVISFIIQTYYFLFLDNNNTEDETQIYILIFIQIILLVRLFVPFLWGRNNKGYSFVQQLTIDANNYPNVEKYNATRILAVLYGLCFMPMMFHVLFTMLI